MAMDEIQKFEEAFLLAAKAGTPLDQQDEDGLTLHHMMMRAAQKNSNFELIKILLAEGMRPDATTPTAIENPKSPEVEKNQKREDWLDAGCPLKEPIVIKNKPLTFNKKPR